MSEGNTEQLFHEKQILHIRISCFVESVAGDVVVVVAAVVVVVAEHFVVSGMVVDFVLDDFVLVPVSIDSLLRVFFEERNIERKLNWLFLRCSEPDPEPGLGQSATREDAMSVGGLFV